MPAVLTVRTTKVNHGRKCTSFVDMQAQVKMYFDLF